MNKVQTNAGLNAGVVISEVDLGCVHEAHFSPHPMLCFCCTTCNSVFISLFVCAHSLATNTMAVNSTWQDLLQWHLMLLFIYCPHLLIYPPSLGCLLFSSFSLWDWWELFLQALHLWNDRGDPGGVTGPVCYKYTYIYFNIDIKELPVWVFTA